MQDIDKKPSVRQRTRMLAFVLNCSLLLASPAAKASTVSEETASAEPSEAANASSEQVIERATKGVWPYKPWRNLKEGALLLLDKQNQYTLAASLAAFAGARALDEEAQEYFDHKNRLGDLDDLGNHVLGTGVPGVMLGAGFWLFGDLTNKPYAAHAGQAQIETLFATGLLTSVLKGAVGRRRPDESDKFSFPSGHTSTVFASAMVLQEFYGWKAGVPGFLLGALTAASRMSDNRHWFSDTVGGATMGILVGHAFSRAHLDRFRSLDDEEKDISFYPVLEDGGARMVFHMTF